MCRSVVEKPAPDDAPSNLAVIGRYVFTPEIFDALRRIEPGRGGEIQLTDAINLLAPGAGGLRLSLRAGAVRRRQPLDYLKADGRARQRTRGPRPGIPRWLEDVRSAEARVAAERAAVAVDWPRWPSTTSTTTIPARDCSRSRTRAHGSSSQVQPLAPLAAPAGRGAGCVLADDVLAAHDMPAFASSAMDGFAVRADDVAGASPARPVELKIVGRAHDREAPEGTVGAARRSSDRDRRADPRAVPTASSRSRTPRMPVTSSGSSRAPPAGQACASRGRGRASGHGAGPAGQAAGRAPSSGCSPTPASRTRSCTRGRASSCCRPATS